jgi:hypothetical protein
MSFSGMLGFVAPKPVSPHRIEWDKIAAKIVELGGDVRLQGDHPFEYGHAIVQVRDAATIAAGGKPESISIEIKMTYTGASKWTRGRPTGNYKICIGAGRDAERLGGGKNGIPYLNVAHRVIAHAHMKQRENENRIKRDADEKRQTEMVACLRAQFGMEHPDYSGRPVISASPHSFSSILLQFETDNPAAVYELVSLAQALGVWK